MSFNPLDKSGFILAVSALWGKIADKFSTLSKVAYSGKYIDLTGTPTIPTKTSQLQNDSGFKTTDTVYTHPATPGNNHIPAGGAAGQFLKWLRDGVAEWASLGAAAFASLANNLATTNEGFALDARVGPVIDQRFTVMETKVEELNSALDSKLPFASTDDAAIVDNPTLLFGQKFTPYGILYTNNGVRLILGYTYPNGLYGAQLMLIFDGSIKWRTINSDDKPGWTDWVSIR